MRIMMLSLLALVWRAQFPAAAQSPGYGYALTDSKRAPGNRGIQDQVEPPITPRKEAQYKVDKFWLKTKAFVDLWSQLAREYNEKGTFNMKVAKEASKAFHALEKSEGWPKAERR